MRKILLILLMSIFFISLVNADTSWGTYKQGECIDLSIVSDADVCIISSLKYPNSSNVMENITMTKIGSEFNSTTCSTNELGIYQAKGMCDATPYTNDFEITPSGNSGSSNIVFFVFIILIIYSITGFGFFGKNIPITILGGMCMIFLGIYTINNGIIIYRDNLTNYFSYVTIGIGLICAIWAGLEQLDVL